MRALITACYLMLSTTAMSQQAYKCQQEDGKVIYQQKECSGEKIILHQYQDQGGGLRGTESDLLIERSPYGAYRGLHDAASRLDKNQNRIESEFKKRTQKRTR